MPNKKFTPRKKEPARPKPNLTEKASSINMGSPLYGKISSACKAAAKKKI